MFPDCCITFRAKNYFCATSQWPSLQPLLDRCRKVSDVIFRMFSVFLSDSFSVKVNLGLIDDFFICKTSRGIIVDHYSDWETELSMV